MKKSLLFFSLIASFTINAQWTSQGTGFSATARGLNEIKIVDANTVWALAYDGSGNEANVQEMTLTTDGGSTWTAKVIELFNPDLEINNLNPVSATTAWVSALIPAEGNGVVFKTEDAGETWTQQLSEGFQTTGESFINGVHFFNANEGVAYGDPLGSGAARRFEIYTTTDGGESWTMIPAGNSPQAQAGEYGYNNSPIVIGDTIWMTTSKGRLYRSSNKGLNWVAYQVTSLADFGGYSTPTQTGTAIFSDVNTGFCLKNVRAGVDPNFTYTRTFATTTNGGQTWSTFAPFSGTRFLLNYIPGTTTIVATSAETPTGYGTSVSPDNGTTWTEVEAEDQRGVSAILNATTMWCAGFSDGDPLGTLGIFKLDGQLATPTVQASKFRVYPNPATSIVTISTADVDGYKLSVTDLSGKIVMTRSLNGIENTVDVSSLATGAYFFELTSDSKREVVKILKN